MAYSFAYKPSATLPKVKRARKDITNRRKVGKERLFRGRIKATAVRGRSRENLPKEKPSPEGRSIF